MVINERVDHRPKTNIDVQFPNRSTSSGFCSVIGSQLSGYVGSSVGWLVEGGLGFPCAASPKQNPTCGFPASGSPERFAIVTRQTFECSSVGYGSSNHDRFDR